MAADLFAVPKTGRELVYASRDLGDDLFHENLGGGNEIKFPLSCESIDVLGGEILYRGFGDEVEREGGGGNLEVLVPAEP